MARPDVRPHSKQEGQYGPNGTPCAPCSAGHFKDWIGAGGCSACPGETSTLLRGSTSSQACACGTGYALAGLACVIIDECTGPPPARAPRHDFDVERLADRCIVKLSLPGLFSTLD